MSTYDYECGACDHTFEVFQTISAPLKRKCPECGRKRLRRLIGPGAALLFRGSGFYKTDYRSESYSKAASADKPAGGGTPAEGKSSAAATSGTSTAESTSPKTAKKSTSKRIPK